ncbi:MAG: hypothetical protein IPQ24_13135 [Anaeromyxobacter sp.]|nr:hypothetical protein [Anaeromyxobacter sp.]
MTTRAALLWLLVAAAPAGAADRIAILAVHDPPAPDGELAELAHQLRAAATDRAAGVLTAPEMRDRLAGKSGGATVQELDRAFGGALAVYQNGEYESAARTLRAIIDDLEDLPESEAVWAQWTRAMARLAHVHQSMKQLEERDAVLVALLRADSSLQLESALYSQTFRAHLDELRQRVRAMPKRRLTVSARGRAGTIFVGGRDVGPTPATVILPASVFRVAGAAGGLRIPGFLVDLTSEDRAVVLDFALAETFRPGAGPGMVLAQAERAGAIIRAGAWLGVERLVVTSRASEGGAQFLVGAIYDVRRGALLREGSVRLISGGVPAANLGALASFLLLGQSSREVLDRTRDPLTPRASAPSAAAVATATSAAAAATTAATVPAAALQPAPAAPPPPRLPLRKAAAPPATPPSPSSPAAPQAAAPGGRAPGPSAPVVPGAGAGAAGATGAGGKAQPAAAPPPAAPPSTPGVAAALGGHAAPPPATPGAGAGAGALPAVLAAAPPPLLKAATPPRAGPPLVTTPAPPLPPDLHPAPPADDAISRGLARAPGEVEAHAQARPRWLRPAALGSGVLAALLTGLAVQQGVAANGAYADADGMIQPNGQTRPGITYPQYLATLARGDDANRNAWVAGGAAAVSATAAGVLYWLSRDPAPAR